MPENSSEPLVIFFTREPFVDLVDLFIDREPDGSPDLTYDAEECRSFLTEKGADPDVVETVLDDVWNWYKGAIRIRNPVDAKSFRRGQPQV